MQPRQHPVIPLNKAIEEHNQANRSLQLKPGAEHKLLQMVIDQNIRIPDAAWVLSTLKANPELATLGVSAPLTKSDLTITRDEFNAKTPQEKSELMRSGAKIIGGGDRGPKRHVTN